jgi:YbbR domain-containing protein
MALRSLLLDHFWLKLISLVLAVLIWLTVRADLGNSSAEATRRFADRPILVLTDKAEHVAVVASPSQTAVTVRGPAALLSELSEQDIHVYVRLNDPRQINGVLPIHAHVPSGASVVLISPASATIKPADAP